ncbi:MAG: polynucleotide kinase-phosphatase [Armatimonas sp.]
MNFELPDFALVALVGSSGSGKSTFAKKHFLPTEILSSDAMRGVVSDDETSLEATGDAFEALHYLAGIRLKNRRLTVVDATNVQPHARKPLLELARRHHAVPVAIVLDVPEKLCHERNSARPDRDFGPHVVARHVKELKRSVGSLRKEGWRYVFHLKGVDEIDAASFTRAPLWTDKRTETGPFDIVGDIHGCDDELQELLKKLGYHADFSHPDNRRLVFVGDIVDRGPKTVEAATRVMDAIDSGRAFCVPGNHDDKLSRALAGKNVTVNHGLQESLDQIAALSDAEREAFKTRYQAFYEKLVSHLWLDNGALVVAHAGLTENLIGRASGYIREFCLYGATTGEKTPEGLPVRLDWAEDYRGKPAVVYGHTPVAEARWKNNTIDIDTGCVFGGTLTALRWPERALMGVPAKHTYAEHPVPLVPKAQEMVIGNEKLLRLSDYLKRGFVETRLMGRVTVAEGNAAAALEILSRFAAPPSELLYLPPTMSPVETSKQDGFLERPEEAFAYFAKKGVSEVICQEKHMGSRAVVRIHKDGTGSLLTRTGRPFFDDANWTSTILKDTADAFEAAGLWTELESDWALLDAELLPWNAKAQGLLREQYAPTGAAGDAVLTALSTTLHSVTERGITGLEEVQTRTNERHEALEKYRAAYRHYCTPNLTLDGVKLAPFHLLAAEGQTFFEKDHPWHLEMLARLAAANPARFIATPNLRILTEDSESVAAGVAWWEERTEAGGEGMVVKPLSFLPPTGCQPALKVRGREYLRIIYGPEYDRPENLTRLRQRGLSGKRALALREFALGIEGLERFTRGDSVGRVHECVFATLALESEPVDPRL